MANALTMRRFERNGDVSPTNALGQNNPMNPSRIDEAILSTVGDRWTKVAKVIPKVADAMASDSPTEEVGLEVISERIDALVGAGRLEAQGNTRNWRFSEVRQAQLKP